MKKLIAWLIRPVGALPTKQRRILLGCCVGISTIDLIFVLFTPNNMCYAIPSIIIALFFWVLTITNWKDKDQGEKP